MRVISQDGTMEFPYEMSTIFIHGRIENAIAIEPAGDSEVSIIGRYSSKEKAIKAMEMLRTKYRKFQEITSENGRYFAFNYPKAFQFPQDSEIEVSK